MKWYAIKNNFFIREVTKSPARISICGFLILIFIGALLLMIPSATVTGDFGFINALFTATSASCVTGLSVVDTGSTFTLFGKIVILGLIQTGGLGIMTLSTLFIFLAGRRPSLAENSLIHDSFTYGGIKDIASLIRNIILVTFVIEAIGAAFLFVRFLSNHDWVTALGYSVFHSVSAFCNAGFSVFRDSFVQYQGDWLTNIVISVLIISGGIGFIVMFDLHYVTSLKNRRWTRLSLHAKLVISGTVILVVAGALLFFMMETGNTFAGLPVKNRILSSLFHSVSARTAGFNTISIGELANETLFFIMLLMFIGAAPGSCGGGIKVTTLWTLILLGISRFRGQEEVRVFNRTIPESCTGKAVGVVLLSISVITMATMVLLATELGEVSHLETRGKFLELLFETVSAFGTVGLSTGITETLSRTGKLVIVFVMFVGRLGPLVIALGLRREKMSRIHYAEENIMIG